MKAETVEVDEALFEVLAVFSAAADQVKAQWLVIGATARIMLLEEIYGWPQGIGTQDIDFAVQVGDWEHYKLLCEYITRNDVFEAERKPTKRFRSKEDWIFDLVPFGGVENEERQVFWPPDSDDVMTVRGFETAAKDAVPVVVNQKLKIQVISPRGLCALKFFAWEERHRQHPGRDAKDIAYLFRHIELLYPADKLFGEYPRAVEIADYKIPNAGHFQLGCEVAKLIAEEEKEFLIELIATELKDNEDSVLCRELHKYTNLQTIEETRIALHYFYKGLEHEL